MPDWSEEQHPRGEGGKFAPSGSAGAVRGAAESGREREEAEKSEAYQRLREAKASSVEHLERIKKLPEADRKEHLRRFVAQDHPEPPEAMKGKWTGQGRKADDETWGKYMRGDKGDEHAATVDPHRKELHDAIKEHFLSKAEPVPSTHQPVAIFNMGAPATGKGQMNRHFEDKNIVKVDPDEVKFRLPEYRDGVAVKNKATAMNVHEESSTVAKQLRTEAIAQRKNFLYDGTGGSVKGYLEAFDQARSAGYHVELRMAYKPVDAARAFQEHRADKSGRWVEPEFFNKAHESIPRNWPKLAPHAHSATMFDTSEKHSARPVWSHDGSTEQHHDPNFVAAYKARHL